MATLVSLLSGFVSDNSIRNQKLVEAIALANNNKAPTIDVNGRLHAPCNGYVYNDSVYSAGEYMSVELSKVGSTSTAKVKITASLKEQIKAVWACVSFGTTWNKDGIELCYAYFEMLTKAQAETLTSQLVANKKRIMLVSEAVEQGLSHGQSWKFSTRKYSNAVAYCFDALQHEVNKDGLDWKDIEIGTGGTKVLIPKFQGKEVCFVYGNNKDYFSE
jgi:hypothetical protein